MYCTKTRIKLTLALLAISGEACYLTDYLSEWVFVIGLSSTYLTYRLLKRLQMRYKPSKP